jgi:uncharacterized protein (DUF302 family)
MTRPPRLTGWKRFLPRKALPFSPVSIMPPVRRRPAWSCHPRSLLLFGNPKLGTPLMKANREVGIALPMKALAWTDADGKTWLAVTDPAALKNQFGLEGVDEVVAKMTGAVTNMGKAATAKE